MYICMYECMYIISVQTMKIISNNIYLYQNHIII